MRFHVIAAILLSAFIMAPTLTNERGKIANENQSEQNRNNLTPSQLNEVERTQMPSQVLDKLRVYSCFPRENGTILIARVLPSDGTIRVLRVSPEDGTILKTQGHLKRSIGKIDIK